MMQIDATVFFILTIGLFIAGFSIGYVQGSYNFFLKVHSELEELRQLRKERHRYADSLSKGTVDP